MVRPATTNKPPLRQLVFLQLLATIVLSLSLAWYQQWSWTVIISVWAGGAVAIGSQLYFTWRSFLRDATEVGPHRLLGDFYQAAMMRFLIVALALAFAFRFFGEAIDEVVLLVAYIVVYLFGVIGAAFAMRAVDIE